MALKEPESMDKCVYFSNRTLEDGKGKIMAWVFKEQCPKCGKALMGKPRDKSGKVQIRAKEYVCPECKYTVPKQDFEDSLTCSIRYTCQHCGKSGETAIPYKRKNFQGVQALVFECQSCHQKIPITKKLKDLKGDDS